MSPAALEAQPLGVFVALVVVALTVLLLALRALRGGARGDAVLLVGPCYSGKTALFTALRDGAAAKTVTSMEESAAAVSLGAKGEALQLVDLPGHPRLRSKLDAHAPRARCVVFVVDAVDFMSSARATAEQLYELLAHPALRRAKPALLLAANKSERVTAYSAEFIRKRLEKELEQLRSTRGALEDTSAKRGGDVGIGKAGEAFSFAHVPWKFATAAISVVGDDLEPLRAFVAAA